MLHHVKEGLKWEEEGGISKGEVRKTMREIG